MCVLVRYITYEFNFKILKGHFEMSYKVDVESHGVKDQ